MPLERRLESTLDLHDLAASPDLPLTSCIASGKSLNNSEPQLSLLG